MATNVMIAGSNPSQVIGTIPVSGTLSEQYDLGPYTHLGLMSIGTITTGSLQFQVSLYSGGPFVDLRNQDGTVAATGSLSGTVAIAGSVITNLLAPYRYVKILASAAQTNGATLAFVTKG